MWNLSSRLLHSVDWLHRPAIIICREWAEVGLSQLRRGSQRGSHRLDQSWHKFGLRVFECLHRAKIGELIANSGSILDVDALRRHRDGRKLKLWPRERDCRVRDRRGDHLWSKHGISRRPKEALRCRLALVAASFRRSRLHRVERQLMEVLLDRTQSLQIAKHAGRRTCGKTPVLWTRV